MCSRPAPASVNNCLILDMACSACAAASPTPTFTAVSRFWPTCPRTNTVLPLATTVWHRSLSSFCSGYVSRVLNLRIRVCMSDSVKEGAAVRTELHRERAHRPARERGEHESAVLDRLRQG